jgi:hypothetical protein
MQKLEYISDRSSFLGTGPIWMFRLFPVMAMVSLVLAMFVFKPALHENAHEFCLGFALGVLIAFSLVSFQVKSVDMKNAPQPSGAEPLRIT